RRPVVEGPGERGGADWEGWAVGGGDLAALPLLARVGLPMAVPRAVAGVKAAARVVTTAAGGGGAAREVAELILQTRGEWKGLLSQYFVERGDVAYRAQRSR